MLWVFPSGRFCFNSTHSGKAYLVCVYWTVASRALWPVKHSPRRDVGSTCGWCWACRWLPPPREACSSAPERSSPALFPYPRAPYRTVSWSPWTSEHPWWMKHKLKSQVNCQWNTFRLHQNTAVTEFWTLDAQRHPPQKFTVRLQVTYFSGGGIMICL